MYSSSSVRLIEDSPTEDEGEYAASALTEAKGRTATTAENTMMNAKAVDIILLKFIFFTSCLHSVADFGKDINDETDHFGYQANEQNRYECDNEHCNEGSDNCNKVFAHGIVVSNEHTKEDKDTNPNITDGGYK